MMSTDPDDELDRLRARAYGPDANIGDDPAAMARLESLEALHRLLIAAPRRREAGSEAESAKTADDSSTVGDMSDRGPGGAPDAGDVRPIHVGDRALDVARVASSASRRRRFLVLWAASVVASALIGFGVARTTEFAATSQGAVLAPAAGAGIDVTRPAVATLTRLPEGSWPTETFGARPGGRQYEWFHDMAVMQVPDLQTAGRLSCLSVVAYARWNATYVADDCSTGLPHDVAALVVTADAPKSLRDAYPIDTRLLFILEDDHVLVYASEFHA
jgi:hypothetical protein